MTALLKPSLLAIAVRAGYHPLSAAERWVVRSYYDTPYSLPPPRPFRFYVREVDEDTYEAMMKKQNINTNPTARIDALVERGASIHVWKCAVDQQIWALLVWQENEILDITDALEGPQGADVLKSMQDPANQYPIGSGTSLVVALGNLESKLLQLPTKALEVDSIWYRRINALEKHYASQAPEEVFA